MAEELAGQLRQLRDLTGRSLRELAGDVRASRSSLSRYFSGQAVPPWPTVVALCKAAGHDPRPLREMWERARDEPQAGVTAIPPVRNDLPRDIAAFTGRREELAALLGAARDTQMVAIDGMGGVGKTALAVHAAHLLTTDFPGGQLYVDLLGFTPGRERVEPAEALRLLLTALGVPVGRIPDGVAERAALWRSELATRHAIVLLDNAADAAHVRDLLPGAGRSFVMVTSRRRMVELDVLPISLDVLPVEEAAELFVASAGGTRPGDVGEVLRRCGNLPLAIRVAAARLRHRPGWTLDTLVERLSEGELAVSDVFGMSLRQLDPAQRRMFRLLGLVPGTDICVYGAAALAGIPLGNARRLLEELFDAHLVQEPAVGRYRLHDLLRQAARADSTEPDDAEAIAGLADYYLSGVLAADRALLHTIAPLPLTIIHPPERVPEIDGTTGALTWLDLEWSNIEAVFALATEVRLDTSVIGLALTAEVYFIRRGGLGRWERMIDAALLAAQRLDDRRSLIWLRFRRGMARHLGGRSSEAMPEFEACRAMMAEAGDVHVEFEVLQRLAEQHMRAGDFEGAIDLLHQGKRILPEGADFDVYRLLAQGRTGMALIRLERYEQAREAVLSVIEIARKRNDPQRERLCLDVLASAALGLGDPGTALELSRQAVAHSRETGHQIFEAVHLTNAAVATRHLGRAEEALALHAEAHRIIEATGEQQYAIGVLTSYGETCRLAGDPVTAERHLRRALELATVLDMPAGEVRRNLRLLRGDALRTPDLAGSRTRVSGSPV
ncbi:ATP-binding protein [Streptosporangium sp. OZ121]|uniref:ATP-binding protein n=1 Tax=Streptosporangium sp. OZ121 TaxID=3444183 RepID=UPI003F7AC981